MTTCKIIRTYSKTATTDFFLDTLYQNLQHISHQKTIFKYGDSFSYAYNDLLATNMDQKVAASQI